MAKRIATLAAEGKSNAEIALSLKGKISKQAVWSHRQKHKTQESAAPTKKIVAPVPTRQVDAPDRQVDEAEIEIPGSPPNSATLEELNQLFTRTKNALAMLDPSEKSNAFIALGKFMLELGERMVELTPRPPIDPASDPANIDARRMLELKIKKMITAKQVAS